MELMHHEGKPMRGRERYRAGSQGRRSDRMGWNYPVRGDPGLQGGSEIGIAALMQPPPAPRRDPPEPGVGRPTAGEPHSDTSCRIKGDARGFLEVAAILARAALQPFHPGRR